LATFNGFACENLNVAGNYLCNGALLHEKYDQNPRFIFRNTLFTLKQISTENTSYLFYSDSSGHSFGPYYSHYSSEKKVGALTHVERGECLANNHDFKWSTQRFFHGELNFHQTVRLGKDDQGTFGKNVLLFERENLATSSSDNGKLNLLRIVCTNTQDIR